MTHRILKASALIMSILLFAGCASGSSDADSKIYIDEAKVEGIMIEEETLALSESPAAIPKTVPAANTNTATAPATAPAANTNTVTAPTTTPAVPPAAAETPAKSPLSPTASGTKVKKGPNVTIDYSNSQDGYVMVQYTKQETKKFKVQVKGPTTTYTYNLTPLKWEVFPLSDGNGNYQVSVFRNVTGTKYTLVTSQKFAVQLSDEFAPFIRSNQYVDYDEAVNTIAKAAEIAGGITDPLKKVEAIYNYVVTNFTYDKQKAQTAQPGYLPVLDTVLEAKKGICFDYASLMTGMLRSQGVPCKLIVGYAGTAYHAWINVWTEETGWIDGIIYFDSISWHRMDPTFASSGKASESVMKYIGDGKNYTTKYIY